MQAALREAGVRHRDIADRIGVDRSYVTHQLRGTMPMMPETMQAARQLIREAERRRLRETARLLDRDGAPDAGDRVRLLAVG